MSHYRERLELLQRLADRLEDAGVPCSVTRHVPAAAPSSPDERTVPALRLGAQLGRVRVLYWRPLGIEQSRPFFVWLDSVSRFATDGPGLDRLAGIITITWRNSRADQRDD